MLNIEVNRWLIIPEFPVVYPSICQEVITDNPITPVKYSQLPTKNIYIFVNKVCVDSGFELDIPHFLAFGVVITRIPRNVMAS